ncbi:hypothetical protein PQR66_38430 [Paraburkholderia agricolaris]|uniref:Uncharacterized protein n=1 Tax=Paraburkholderia agricolaris TaxID=2152888 RepID=A0ABW9A349_9BURK
MDSIEGEIHIERDLAYFDTEDEAIALAQEWAFAWISEHDRGGVDTHNQMSAPQNSISNEIRSR